MDDYVMVPKEPTKEMVLNGVWAFQHAYSATDNLADWKACYCAMISMSPIPQEKVRKPLTEKEISETCDTWIIDSIGIEEVIFIVRRTELAHGIGVENE
jgi:hypothetical protein